MNRPRARRPWSRAPESDVVRITSAAPSHAEDIAARQRRYVISMTIRTACFVGAVLIGDGWLRWILVAGAVFLPYAAVVMANSGRQREDAFDPEAPGVVHPALPGPVDAT